MHRGLTRLTMEILLVDDDQGDVRLTREALKRSKATPQLNVVEDGQEAIAYLRRQGKYANAALPDLILLDLNMPRKDGREVLAEIKQDLQLKHIPVVILTTSTREEDVRTSYDLHANCFITKPADLKQFMAVVRAIDEFWFTIVKLPVK
jgi:chemotaxis family two-component system response regulator Rcp1